jgi:hypothetical protein
MVVTNEDKRNGRPDSTAEKKSSKKSAAKRPADRVADVSRAIDAELPEATAGSPRSSRSAASSSRPEPLLVTARAAARRIARLADVGDTLDARNRLRQLAALVRKGGGNAQRIAFIETAVADCLDESGRAASPVDRWLSCEAATWTLAWMTRTKRAGGSAGGLLERLVGQARAAQPLFAAGDTLPARFVLALARLFRDIEACRCLEEGAATTLAAEIDRLVSSDGSVNLTGSAAVVERVVRWTSARETALATGGDAWGESVERRWKAAATAALRLLGGRGRLLAGGGQMPAAFTAPLLDALAEMGGRRGRTVATVTRHRRNAGGCGLLPRDHHDPVAGVAVIRTGWDRRSVRVMLDYRHPVPRLEVAVADRVLIEGPWQWEASADGRPLEVEGAWTVSCWESDRKATFLEISAAVGDGRHLERQVVVLPRDRIVVLADAITTPGGSVPACLRYRGTLPLAASLDADMAAETREICVFDTAMRFLALPLALNEWRAGGRGGFEAAAAALVLSQESAGGRLYAPVWLDCDASRVGRPLTWRQLTVADTRLILPPHQAAGFRVQAGSDQWILYRALDEARNRTLLGCNVSGEFLLGRIKRSGEVARTLEIQ